MNSNINFNIEIIIDEYSNYVFKIVDNIIGTSLPYQDKEEIVSDVFYLLWKNQANINNNLKGYLGVIAKNCSYSKLRRSNKNFEYQDNLLNNNISIKDFDFDYMLTIKQKLAKLSLEEQQIFKLYYVEGYKIKEISNKLDMKASLVKVKLYRLRKKLREEFI